VAGGESHAGDLGNVTVGEDGRLSVTITTSTVTLQPGQETSLNDADGSALVIHAHKDDLHTDPSGDSGDRLACAVLFPSADGAAAGAEATPASSPAAESTDNAGSESAASSVTIQAEDSLKFVPDTVTVSPGDTITVTNTGALEHDIVIDDLGISEALPNGQPVTITIPKDAKPGDYTFYCSIPGHEAAGMKGTLTVK